MYVHYRHFTHRAHMLHSVADPSHAQSSLCWNSMHIMYVCMHSNKTPPCKEHTRRQKYWRTDSEGEESWVKELVHVLMTYIISEERECTHYNHGWPFLWLRGRRKCGLEALWCGLCSLVGGICSKQHNRAEAAVSIACIACHVHSTIATTCVCMYICIYIHSWILMSK